MSLLIIVSVRDIKANSFGALGVCHTAAVAVRGFSEDVNGRDPLCSKHPEDMELFELGVYDTDTGQIAAGVPKLIVTGLSLVEKKS